MLHKQFRIPLPACEVMAYYHICSHLRPGDTVIDVGAHIGRNTILAAALIGPRGKVLAVEPVSELRKVLADHVQEEKLSNVDLYPFALTSPEKAKQKEMDLFVSQSEPLAMQNRSWIEESEKPNYQKITVPCTTVDALARDLDHVDFIKIDVEGTEPDILRGSTETIKRNPGIGLLVELRPYGLRKQGSSMNELLKQLEDFGMAIYLLDEWEKTPKRIDSHTRVTLPRPNIYKPESPINSQVHNLWCIRRSWDIDYSGQSPKGETAGSIIVNWHE